MDSLILHVFIAMFCLIIDETIHNFFALIVNSNNNKFKFATKKMPNCCAQNYLKYKYSKKPEMKNRTFAEKIFNAPVFANATPRDSQRSTWLIVAVHYPY